MSINATNANASQQTQGAQHAGQAQSTSKAEYKGLQMQVSNGGVLDASDMEEAAMMKAGKKCDLTREQKKVETKKEQKANAVEDAQESLEDSMEEMGQASRRSKAELNQKDGQRSGGREFKFEHYQKLLNKVPDLGEEQLQEAFAELTDLNNEDPEVALKQFLSKFSDTSHKYIGLLYAKENIDKQMQDHKQVKALNPALTGYFSALHKSLMTQIMDLLQESGSEVVAGINISEISEEFAKALGANSLAELRSFYRTHILHYLSLWDAYEKMKRRFKNYKKARQFMQQALTADLAAEQSSIDEEQLAYIMNDLQQFRIIDKLYDDSDGLFENLSKNYMIPKRKKEDFCEGVIGFFQESVTRSGAQRKMDKLVRALALRAIEGQIGLYTGVLNIIKATPVRVFKSDRERMRVLEALQEKVDVSISTEEKQMVDKLKKENKDVDQALLNRKHL